MNNMKTNFLFLILIFIPLFISAQTSKIDSIFSNYKNDLDIYSQIDPEISRLESIREKLNENLGVIILEQDLEERKRLIRSLTRKDLHPILLKKSLAELEEFRKDNDDALKIKIGLLCLKIDMKENDEKLMELQKSKVRFLLDRGYNLSEFAQLSEEQQKEIMKNWTLKDL